MSIFPSSSPLKYLPNLGSQWDKDFFGSKTGKGIAQLKKMKFLNIFIMYIIVYYANLNNQRKTLKLKFKNLIVLTIPLRTGSDG